MYGKHFASMYEGSMRGSGPEFFSVWGYVISHMMPNKEYGTTVELNPGIIGFLIGMPEAAVLAKIEQMCQPDAKSRTKDEEGRKLVKVAEYTYRVVNGDYYRSIRNEQDRREYQRKKQAEYRKKKRKGKAAPIAGSVGESEYECALRNGATDEELDEIVTRHLPAHLREQVQPYIVHAPL